MDQRYSKMEETTRYLTVTISRWARMQAVIEGKGNYTGQLTAEFTIAKEVLDISNA